MPRWLDVVLAVIALMMLLPIALAVALAVRLTSPGPILYWSDRVGRLGTTYAMPKFRSMKVDTLAVASHLLTDPASVLTPIGGFIRRTSLDEIPQLWSVIRGDMALVGPRPALFNQDDLIALRRAADIDRLRPGITGWAQINGRDELAIPRKVELDREYLLRRSAAFDARIMILTVAKLVGDRSVSH